MPPDNYNFPYNEVMKQGKLTRKYAQRSHFEQFPWLVLSDKDQGLYCKYCVLFSAGLGCGSQKSVPFGKLVKEPLERFNKLLGMSGDLIVHSRLQYHAGAVQAGKDFLKVYQNPSLEITNQMDSHRLRQIEENRQRLIPIIKTIIFCGRQGLSLRGHRDDKKIHSLLEPDGECAGENFGNFLELLRFRVDAGDVKLRNHLESAAGNALFTSKTIQNELIDCCKEEIQSTIIKRVKEAKFFSIIFDETTDVSKISQMSISVRYLHRATIREDFLTFVDAYDNIRDEDTEKERGERRLTGVALAHIVEDIARNFDLDLDFCVGFGTDNCSVMASEVMGAVQELKKKAKHAQRCPCLNHILNNSLCSSSKVAPCRNASGTMTKVVVFANASSKRNEVFKNHLGAAVQGICETRWVERHDGFFQFHGEAILKIVDALEEISAWMDANTATDAFNLAQALKSAEFLLSVACLSDVLGVTVSLSRLLQTPTLDLKRGIDAVKDTMGILEQKRENVDSVFSDLYYEVREILEKLDVQLKMPRLVGRQTKRENHPAQSPEEYYRRSIYIQLLDHVLADLKDRLSAEVMDLFCLRVILPRSKTEPDDDGALRKIINLYQELIGHCTTFAGVKHEFLLWTVKWERVAKNQGKLPDSVLEALENCDLDMYPTIHKLLSILATLPVSAATAERSFSTLRRLKTWLRSNIGESRLTGLALLSIHRDISPDPEDILQRFAKGGKRRLDLLL